MDYITALFVFVPSSIAFVVSLAYLMNYKEPQVYTVRSTWTDKEHVTTSYEDAKEWMDAYRNVDCMVWIETNI